jgi:hypothetical protein
MIATFRTPERWRVPKRGSDSPSQLSSTAVDWNRTLWEAVDIVEQEPAFPGSFPCWTEEFPNSKVLVWIHRWGADVLFDGRCANTKWSTPGETRRRERTRNLSARSDLTQRSISWRWLCF